MQEQAASRESLRVLEDYLKAIYRLEELYGVARTTWIARELGVKPATVTKMITKFARRGYVEWEKYRGVRLTDKGREIAEKIVRKHRIAEVFFRRVLGFSLSKCHVYAHMLEHLPDEVFDRLYEFMGRPATCPHGNPIPGARPPPEVLEAKPLTSYRPRTLVKIVRIACEADTEVLENVEKLGLDIGTIVCLEEVKPTRVIARKGSEAIALEGVLAVAIRGIAIGTC